MAESKKDDGANKLLSHDFSATEEIEWPGLPIKWVVKGLSRDEVIAAANHKKDGDVGVEARFIAIGTVEPTLTYDEVRALQKKPGTGFLTQHVAEQIQRLSGLSKGARREAMELFLE